MTAITLTVGSWYLHRDGTRYRCHDANDAFAGLLPEDLQGRHMTVTNPCSVFMRDLGPDYRPDVIAPGQVYQISSGKLGVVDPDAVAFLTQAGFCWEAAVARDVTENRHWRYLGTLGPRGLYGVLARMAGVE